MRDINSFITIQVTKMNRNIDVVKLLLRNKLNVFVHYNNK